MEGGGYMRKQDTLLLMINWYNRLPAMMKLTCRCREGKNVHIFVLLPIRTVLLIC